MKLGNCSKVLIAAARAMWAGRLGTLARARFLLPPHVLWAANNFLIIHALTPAI